MKRITTSVSGETMRDLAEIVALRWERGELRNSRGATASIAAVARELIEDHIGALLDAERAETEEHDASSVGR